MGKSTNFSGQPIFNRILKLIDNNEIRRIGKQHGTERYVKRFTTYNHLIVMLFVAFEGYHSIRETIIGLFANAHKLAHLGRGINFGNMMEAPYEGAWSSIWEPEYSKMLSDLGFNHIRIPIYWESEERSMATPPYTINTDFINRIKGKSKSWISLLLILIKYFTILIYPEHR